MYTRTPETRTHGTHTHTVLLLIILRNTESLRAHFDGALVLMVYGCSVVCPISCPSAVASGLRLPGNVPLTAVTCSNAQKTAENGQFRLPKSLRERFCSPNRTKRVNGRDPDP